MRYLYSRAALQAATMDHDYFDRQFTEFWVDRALEVTAARAEEIERSTILQSKCKKWFLHREWRITSSHFGTIFHMTERRYIEKLCSALLFPPQLSGSSILHGKQYESIAITAFENQMDLKVTASGLCILPECSFLGASPDGFVNEKHTVEVKCPYTGRENQIKPGKDFPFLMYDAEGNIQLRNNHPYYCQVQGQLALSKRDFCYFVVFTPGNSQHNMIVLSVPFDREFWEGSLLPKLNHYYSHYRPFVASRAPSLL